MSVEVYRVEYDCSVGNAVGIFLAEFHTDNPEVAKLCKHYRKHAPCMPEPEHASFDLGIPYCIKFGCTSLEQLMDWFGGDHFLLKKVLKVFKLRVYTMEEVLHCEQQVGFDPDDAINTTELTYEDVDQLLEKELEYV